MTDTPTLASPPGSDLNAQTRLVERMLAQVHTATPVKIVAVHPGGTAGSGTVDVQPLVDQVNEAGQSVPHSKVFGLPYHRHAAGGAAVIIEPMIGDLGLAVFASRDTSAFKATRKQGLPGSYRRHSMSDGFYFGGVMTAAAEHFVQIGPAGVALETTAAITLKAPTIALTSDTLTHNGVSISSTHEHKNVQNGSGVSGPPVS